MRDKGLAVVMLSAASSLREQVIEHEGCPHLIVPMARQIALWQDWKCLWLMIREMRRLRPDIVHAQTPKAGLLAMLAAKITGVPIRIQTVGGTPPDTEHSRLKRWIMHTTERLTFWAATQVWPNSFSLRDFILQHQFAPPEKLTVIGFGSSNGIDLTQYCRAALQPEPLQQLKTTLDYDPAKTYFLFVGRLLWDKGIVELVTAFLNFAATRPQVQLLLLGTVEAHRSPLPPSTLNAIASHPQITVIGWSNQVEYYMAIAHYLIHPSHREGFPNVLLQAGAMQTPILAADVVGNRDCIQHQITGYLFPKQNATAIENALQFALEHPTDMQHYAQTWYQQIITRFERKQVQQYYYEKYCELLGGDAFKTSGNHATLP